MKTKCKICNKEMTLEEVIEAASPLIDTTLCYRHLSELSDALREKMK